MPFTNLNETLQKLYNSTIQEINFENQEVCDYQQPVNHVNSFDYNNGYTMRNLRSLTDNRLISTLRNQLVVWDTSGNNQQAVQIDTPHPGDIYSIVRVNESQIVTSGFGSNDQRGCICIWNENSNAQIVPAGNLVSNLESRAYVLALPEAIVDIEKKTINLISYCNNQFTFWNIHADGSSEYIKTIPSQSGRDIRWDIRNNGASILFSNSDNNEIRELDVSTQQTRHLFDWHIPLAILKVLPDDRLAIVNDRRIQFRNISNTPHTITETEIVHTHPIHHLLLLPNFVLASSSAEQAHNTSTRQIILWNIFTHNSIKTIDYLATFGDGSLTSCPDSYDNRLIVATNRQNPKSLSSWQFPQIPLQLPHCLPVLEALNQIRNPSVQKLNLSGINLTGINLDLLNNFIRSANSKVLNLTNTQLTDAQFAAIAEKLRHARGLNTLFFAGNDSLTGNSIETLHTVLQNNHTLRDVAFPAHLASSPYRRECDALLQRNTNEAEELVTAANDGNLTEVERLLRTGITPRYPSRYSRCSALYRVVEVHIACAAICQHINIAQQLLQHGAEPKACWNQLKGSAYSLVKANLHVTGFRDLLTSFDNPPYPDRSMPDQGMAGPRL